MIAMPCPIYRDLVPIASNAEVVRASLSDVSSSPRQSHSFRPRRTSLSVQGFLKVLEDDTVPAMSTEQTSADAIAEVLDPAPAAVPDGSPAASTDSTPLPSEPPSKLAPAVNGPSHSQVTRLRKGMKAEDAYPSPFTPVGDAEGGADGEETTWLLNAIESPFQVQEYIALLVRADPHNVERIVRLPERPNGVPSSNGKGKAPASEKDKGQDVGSGDGTDDPKALVNKDVWVYEQLRRFSQDLSHPWVTSLQEECTREGCPEMKAGEWLYLCAAHATANEVRSPTADV